MSESGGQRIRAFFGIPLPAELEGPALDVQKLMRRRASHKKLSLRFPEGDHLHLTLKFMGWIASEDLPRLTEGLAQIAADFAPIVAEAQRLDAFPTPKRGRVVVIHLSDPARALPALAERFEALAESIGIPRETRAFKSHVTVARLSPPGDVRELLGQVPFAPTSLTFDRVRLYQSTLLPTGSVYSVLSEAEFTGSRGA